MYKHGSGCLQKGVGWGKAVYRDGLEASEEGYLSRISKNIWKNWYTWVGLYTKNYAEGENSS